MQEVQTVAEVQVAHGDVHAVQVVPERKYPVAHEAHEVEAVIVVH